MFWCAYKRVEPLSAEGSHAFALNFKPRIDSLLVSGVHRVRISLDFSFGLLRQ